MLFSMFSFLYKLPGEGVRRELGGHICCNQVSGKVVVGLVGQLHSVAPQGPEERADYPLPLANRSTQGGVSVLGGTAQSQTLKAEDREPPTSVPSVRVYGGMGVMLRGAGGDSRAQDVVEKG